MKSGTVLERALQNIKRWSYLEILLQSEQKARYYYAKVDLIHQDRDRQTDV
jgi:hypothetical protein